MTQQWTMPAWLVLASAACLVLLVVLALAAIRWGMRATRSLAAREAESAALGRQVEEIRHRLAGERPVATREEGDFVITALGDEQPAPVVAPALFADIVLRESVVRSASLLHGLRRALSPQARDRIRSEVRREVKRSRRQRRTQQKAAHRAGRSRDRLRTVRTP